MTLYSTTAELDFALAELAPLSAPDHILMADPAEFDVLYAINAHMRGADGALLKVDREEARRQWWCLREALEDLGLHVDVLAPLEGQPDLVFCANQCLPIPFEVTGSAPIALASQMANAERATEDRQRGNVDADHRQPGEHREQGTPDDGEDREGASAVCGREGLLSLVLHEATKVGLLGAQGIEARLVDALADAGHRPRDVTAGPHRDEHP